MRRLFWLVAAVVLVDTMFFAAVAPLLPHYSDELNLSKTGAGVLTAAYPAGTFVGALPAGWLAIRWGVKPTLMAGLAMLGLSSLAFAFAGHIVLLDGARFIQGIGGACMWAAGMAWLVSAAPVERRGELIGAALSAAIVGVLLGPVLGGAATLLSPEVVFSAVSVLAVVLAAWAWTMPGVEPEQSAGIRAMLRALRRPAVIAGFWLFTIPALFAGVVEVLVPLRMDDLGASGAAIGAVFLVAAGVEATISPIAGRWSDRAGRLAPIRAGLIGAAVMAVVLPLPERAVVLALAVVVAIASLAVFWAPGMAMLSDAAEDAGLDQALAFSLSNLAWAAGHILGAGVGGAIAEATADAVPYAGLAVACVLTLLGLTANRRRHAGAAARLRASPQLGQGAVPRRLYSFRASRSCCHSGASAGSPLPPRLRQVSRLNWYLPRY